MATIVDSKLTIRPKLFGWLALGGLGGLLGAGLWYAYSHGGLAFACNRVHALVSKRSAGKSGPGGMGGMNMPGMGMDMGDMEIGSPSAVEGHAEVKIPAEIQQRIGVTIGQVERAPLRMSVRTVGIAQ